MATTIRGKLFNVKNGSAATGANFCPLFLFFWVCVYDHKNGGS